MSLAGPTCLNADSTATLFWLISETIRYKNRIGLFLIIILDSIYTIFSFHYCTSHNQFGLHESHRAVPTVTKSSGDFLNFRCIFFDGRRRTTCHQFALSPSRQIYQQRPELICHFQGTPLVQLLQRYSEQELSNLKTDAAKRNNKLDIIFSCVCSTEKYHLTTERSLVTIASNNR